MVAYIFNLSTQSQRQTDLYELEASLVYILSSRPAMVYRENLFQKEKKKVKLLNVCFKRAVKMAQLSFTPHLKGVVPVPRTNQLVYRPDPHPEP